jgi:iron complex outermembrane receptor protein
MSNSRRATLHASCLCAAIAAALTIPACALAQEATNDPPPPSARTLDTVEVRGKRPVIETERALTPGAVNIVDTDTFHERTVGNTADALRYVPGVWTESGTGGDAVFISSRGSNLDATDYDGNGIKLFQDGLPVSTADGNNHNRFVDPLSARFIAVARGANALTYGASTLGGAIDFASTTARNTPSRLSLAGGDFGAVSGRLVLGGVSGDLDGQVTLDEKDRDGYRDHSRQRRHSMYANGGWQPTPGFELRVFATRIDNKEQLAGALTRGQFEDDPRQANPSAISGNFQLNVRTDRLAIKGEWAIDDQSRLEFGASHEDQDLYHPIVDKVLVDFDGSGPNPPVEVFSLLKDTGQRTTAGMVRYDRVIGDHDLLAGINLAYTHETGGDFRNDHGRRNGQTGIIDNRSDSAELFLVDRWHFAPDWTLVYGAQGVLTGRDVRTTDLASGTVGNPKNDYSSFNPRLGVLRAMGRTGEAFASISRLYEAPTTFELQDDVRGGDATLEAMHGSVVELGLRGATPAAVDTASWHWEASVYYARIHDEILSVDDPAAPGTSLSANIDRTTHAGIEALLGASFPFAGGSHRIEPLVSATWNDFHFDNDPAYGDNRLPAAPDYAVRGEVMYRHQNGFFAGPTFDLIGSRRADFANTWRIRPHRLLGLRAGIKRERWELFGEVRNLLDKDYVATLGVRDEAAADAAILQPGAPRSVSVGLRLDF